MIIALAQLNYTIGDFDKNVSRIISCLEEVKKQGAGLVIFSELCVCGYPPRDNLEFNYFVRASYESVLRIAAHCRNIAAIVGAPTVNPAERGKPLYNSAYYLSEGTVTDVIHKTLLPNYDVFDESRYFEPNRLSYKVITYRGHRIAVTICEDLWNLSDDPLYVRNPMEELIRLSPDLIVNIAASPFDYTQPCRRMEVLAKNASTFKVPIVYVNQVGGQTELLFDGGSMVLNATGKIVTELKRFQEDTGFIDLSCMPLPIEKKEERNDSRSILIHDALVMGIRDYFSKMGFSKAILGLSGGIDSAVTLALASKALGSSNLKALLLPSRFSTDHSLRDAVALAENLGISYDTIRIDEPFGRLEELLKPRFKELPFGVAEENIQARVRAVILMAFANKFGYILLNTSNKSEAAAGYGTLYGDMCGGLSVLGDVYKTQVYELAKHINRDSVFIPENTIIKPPSAELRYGQKDSDSLPEYDLLDPILYRYIEERKGPAEIIKEGFDEAVVRKVLKMVNTSEWKRSQAPPILRVSPKAFGTGRRMPIVGVTPP